MATSLSSTSVRSIVAGVTRGEQALAPFLTRVLSSGTASPVNEHEREGKVFHPDLLNQQVKDAQYAVRGELYLRGTQLAAEGKKIMYTNVGNPHALGQQPLTFNRQVLALVCAPFLMDHPKAAEMFPSDAIDRARTLVTYLSGGVGAYSDSRGMPGVRKEVAKFIEERDGHPADPEHIFLTDGASVAVRLGLNTILRNAKDSIMVPIPQYPLYSASISLYGGTLLPYELNEQDGWGLDIPGMKASLEGARAQGQSVRALVFINPGNPTGQCLSRSNLEELVRFAYEERLVLMADEVYQENIYQDERPFISARRVMKELGEPYASGVELLSFHTVSKGVFGECGLRGGYVEMSNIHPGTVEEMYKCASINLSPNTVGQVMMALMCQEPKAGQPSYEQYQQEKAALLASLRRRAHAVTDGFNALEGVSCNFTEGAMYSFPQIRLPRKALEAAQAAGKPADVFYCLKLLEATGISTVPGSGFGQAEGTLHLRTTILPMEEEIQEFVQKFQAFHSSFMKQYA